MERLWTRVASVALAGLLALAVGGVMTAHARTVGELIDDARIAAEITARLTADSPSNLVKVNVKSESGIVTLDGTVDSEDKRARAAQIASAVDGVKGLVNNIQIAGAPSTPTSASRIDATGTVASVDPSAGTITLKDGRVLRANDRTSVYQPTTVQALKPGDQVLVRGASPVIVQVPEMRMGTVSRVDANQHQLTLTDGTVVHVPPSARVHRDAAVLTLGQIDPGAEVVIHVAPPPSASPRTTTSPPTTSPRTTPPSSASSSTVLDAADVNVVWTPAGASR